MSRRWVGTAGILAAGATAGAFGVRRSIGRVRLRPDAEGREAFGRLPAERTQSVPAEGQIALYVEEAGDLDAHLTMVFVHGFGLSMDSWHYQRRDLGNPALVRLVLVDARGHGRSSGRGGTLGQLTADLAAVLEQVAAQGPLVLVGHAIGAATICALADLRPELFTERVVGVALLSLPTAGTGAAVAGLSRRVRFLRSLHAPALAFSVTRRLCFGGRVSPAVVDAVAAMLGSAPAESLGTAGEVPLVLREVETLLLAGGSDRLSGASASRAAAEVLPDADLVVLPGAGHLLMMERPSLVTFHLQALVSRARERIRGSA